MDPLPPKPKEPTPKLPMIHSSSPFKCNFDPDMKHVVQSGSLVEEFRIIAHQQIDSVRFFHSCCTMSFADVHGIDLLE